MTKLFFTNDQLGASNLVPSKFRLKVSRMISSYDPCCPALHFLQLTDQLIHIQGCNSQSMAVLTHCTP
jgi:hypothetical protein